MPIHQNNPSPDIIGTLFVTTSDKIGGVVSAAAISSPLWLQTLRPYSEVASVFVPILGCIYLSLQIGFKLYDRSRKDD